MTAIVTRGDAGNLHLPDETVDLIVTSPPYFGLRSYQDGGEHYEGQVGDEATPAEYLDALMACTAEWMRALKPGGSIFVNLGDRYANADSSPGGASQLQGGTKQRAVQGQRGKRERRTAEQMTRSDAAWLAGVIDSDGSISVHVNKQPEGNAPSFVAWVRIGQMRPEVVQRAAEITGTGQVYKDARGVWNWSASAQQARWVLERIWPWLLIKQRPALAAIEVARHVEERNAKGSWRKLTAEDVIYRQRLRDAVHAWNRGDEDDLQVPAPRKVSLPDYRGEPKTKSLTGLPWRYAIRCIDELGLILRAEIVWAKPNGLPESVTDRVRRSHEQVFHFVKQPRYYSAVDEVREPHAPWTLKAREYEQKNGGSYNRRSNSDRVDGGKPDYSNAANPLGKLPGSVWTIPTSPLKVPASLGIDHFAAYPPELVRRIVLGWSPREVCTACGEGRRPVVDKVTRPLQATYNGTLTKVPGSGRQDYRTGVPSTTDATITGYACNCGTFPGSTLDPDTSPGVVLDPFGGTGTTALVASAHGRVGISVDLSADYCRLAQWRTTDPGERARVLGVEKPPVQVDGQLGMFDGLSA